MHVCVIGAGVIGVTTAWQLVRKGWDVTLVDAAADPAMGASHANGGQLSYSYVAPLAEPGVLPNLPSWLLSSSSPLRFRPRLEPAQWLWCLQFLKACNARTAATSAAQMLTLSFLSRTVLEEILQEVPIEFGHLKNGKLIVYRSPELLEKARSQVDYQARLGASQEILTARQCIELEPGLAAVACKLAGAVYTSSEEAGDCRKFTQGLFDHMASTGKINIHMQTSIRRLERTGKVIRAAITQDNQRIEADQFVIASGVGSRQLLKPLGSSPPLYPLKGYSLSVPCAADQGPAISVTDYERRTVYAKLDGILRIAAMVCIGSKSGEIEANRIALIKRQIHELLPNLDLTHAQAWAGERPATPSGLPLIGHSRAASNLWLNIGHGALGFTLACGSSRLLETLMSGTPPDIDTAPFQPKC